MGLFDRLKRGLAKTRERIASGFRAVLPFGRKIDDAVLAELETTMLAAIIARMYKELNKLNTPPEK